MSKIKIVDHVSALKDLVTFIPNKYQPVHRWFLLVEGFSSEFVRRIIGEQTQMPVTVLDPFGGVGTTALTCQNLGIKCHSIENNPFISQVARAKLATRYESGTFKKLIDDFEHYLLFHTGKVKYPLLESQTFFQSKNKEKWIFHKSVAEGLIDIATKVKEIELEAPGYGPLFKVALGSILVPISNVFRNGKCLSYRNNWQNKKYKRTDVHRIFLNVCKNVMLIDVRAKELNMSKIENADLFRTGDARQVISVIPDNEIDLVITSPPYLNSRDYTDIYRLELWLLGYVSTFGEERSLRESALTSHVQGVLREFKCPEIKELKSFVCHLENMNGKLWNKSIPNMIKGYFHDIEELLINMRPKLKKRGKVYLNVSNSAYIGRICEVDMLIAKLAEKRGYKPVEIRLARYIKSSSQQKITGKLRESLVVLERD